MTCKLLQYQSVQDIAWLQNKSYCLHSRDAWYTGTGKIPVYIMLQTVRYHFAQFGISYAAVAKCTCRWQCFPNCCATGKCDNRTGWIKQMKLLSTHPKLIKRTGEVKYGITLHTKQMTKVNKLRLLHLYASVAINHVLPQEATHQTFLRFAPLLILIFSEN